jgi:glycosyltransferase involved in cell wall biosynthesis
MRILVVGNGATGVDEVGNTFINKHTGQFLHSLDQHHEVIFAQSQVPYQKDKDLSDFQLNKWGIDFVAVGSLKDPKNFLGILGLIKKSDFIYSFFPGTLSRVFCLFSIVLGKKYGIYLRGQHFDEYFFDKMILRKACFLKTVSPIFRDQLRRLNEDIDVIKPMIDIDKDDIFAGEKRQNPSVWNFLTVGRVEPRKGSLELVEIARILFEKGLKFKWDVVGGGVMIDQCQDLVEKYGMNDNVRFHGQLSDKLILSQFYQNADIFVFLSHDEGFPRVLYEAMAFKLPIFTTFVGGIPGRMIDGANCFKLPVRDPLGASDVLELHLANNGNLEKIALAGQSILKEILDGTMISHEQLLINNLKNLSIS